MAWRVVKEISRDRTRYAAGVRLRFDESNRHGDALDWRREDFSLAMHGDGSGEEPERDPRSWSGEWKPVVDAGPVPALVGKVVARV